MKQNLIALAILAATAAPASADWFECRDNFETRVYEEVGPCGTAGCIDDDGKDVYDVCGAPPHVTGNALQEIKDMISAECSDNGDFNSMLKGGHFVNAVASHLWFISKQDAEAACAAGPAIAAKRRAESEAKEAKKKAAEEADFAEKGWRIARLFWPIDGYTTVLIETKVDREVTCKGYDADASLIDVERWSLEAPADKIHFGQKIYSVECTSEVPR